MRTVYFLVLSTILITVSGFVFKGYFPEDEKSSPRNGSIKQNASPPNILVFVADDQGWRDLGSYGNETIKTPNIDELAENGLKVEEAFLTTPQCSPSRISMLTGTYPHETGTEDLHTPLPEDVKMAPAYLRETGYYTGHMQKTHYGQYGREQFNWYSDDLEDFTDFIDASGDQPFFMWVGFYDSHRPFDKNAIDEPHDPENVIVPPQLADTESTRKDLALYYDEIARMDQWVGKFMDELENRDVKENTLVIYLSDNGAPFPGEKGTLYDAGIRTPLIFSWPGKIEKGSVYDDLVSTVDLAPTILDVAGMQVPEPMTGKSIQPVFYDQSVPGREFVYSERNWHDCDEHIRSVRTKDYKFILNAYTELPHGTPADLASSPSWYDLLARKKEDALTSEQARIFKVPRPRVELYDMQEDPYEFDNLAGTAAHGGKARELAQNLENWKKETGDHPPWKRVRDDHTDRVTGVRFGNEVPPLRELETK